MKKTPRHIIFTSLLSLLALTSPLYLSAAPDSTKPDNSPQQTSKSVADSLYNQGAYASAIEIYSTIIKEKGVSPELYYNLGNCYYKENDMAHAILNYERALKLAPSDEDIRHNLSLSRSKIQDKNNAPTEFFIVTWWYALSNYFSLSFLKSIGLISFILFLALVLLYKFPKFSKFKGYIKTSMITMLILSIISNLLAYQQFHNSISIKGAIVINESASIKSSPSENSIDLFTVHSGTRLNILDNSMNEWCEVKYEDGKEGWIEKKNIELI